MLSRFRCNWREGRCGDLTRVGTVALGRPCRATLGFFRGRAALDGFSVGLMDAARRRVVGRGAQLSIPLHEKGCPMVSRSLRNVGFHGPNPSVDFADSLHPVVILSEATASRMRSSRAVEGSLLVCNAPSRKEVSASTHDCLAEFHETHSSVPLIGILRLRCRSLRDRQLRSG